MERAAFARALRFLNHRPAATWSALGAGVLGSLLFFFLLVLLALFADLLVHQGRVPAFSDLPLREQNAFLNWLQEKDTPEARQRWSKSAANMGFPAPVAALLTRDPDKLFLPERQNRIHLAWQVHLPAWIAERVNAEAGDAVHQAIEEQNRRLDPLAVLYQGLPDLGILSLTARTHSTFQGWIAGVLAQLNSWTWARGNSVYLQGLFVLALVLGLARTGLLFLSEYLAGIAVLEAVTRLRRSLYQKTYRLGTLAFRTLSPSEAVGISTRHLEGVHEGLFTWLTVYFREPAKFGLLLFFAMLVNFWLALAFLLFAVLVWAGGGQIATFFRRRGRSAAHRAADQLAHLQESLMMLRLAKTYLMEQFNQNRLERQLRLYAEAQRERYRADATYVPLFTFLGLFAALVLFLLTGLLVLNGHLGVTSGVVLATALVCLYWPVVSFLAARRVLKRSRLSAQVVFEFLDRPGTVGQMAEAEFLPALSRSLELDNVSIKDPASERRLLNGINLVVRAGEKVALVGPDETEKHALVYLLPRLLDPTAGEIRIDKKNIRWVTLDSLRTHIGMVLQNNLVFNDTVANNIGCGDPAYPLPRIMEAAKIAHAHQFILKLPRGYETAIGELGHALSQGEKFLIALARAILRDPPLLVIEEPSMPLGEDFKALVDDTYARFLPDRTVIFLPHRLSTIRRCDRVYLLYQGKIEGFGEHRELLAQNDLYRHLQYLEFNEFAGLHRGTVPPEGTSPEANGEDSDS